jgi:hypothetical protein
MRKSARGGWGGWWLVAAFLGVAGCSDAVLDDPPAAELVSPTVTASRLVAPPTLLAPDDGATLTEARPIFTWTLDGRDRVVVQICADAVCTQVTHSLTSGPPGLNSPEGSVRPRDPLPPGPHFWRAARVRGFLTVSAWTAVRSFVVRGAPLVVTQDLFGVWSVATYDVFAVGAAGTILHYGGGWAYETSPTTQDLRSVWAAPGGQAWAVGAGGTILRRDGVGWSVVASPTTQDLHGVWASGIDDAWAVGQGGLILHGAGGVWSVAHDRGAGNLLAVWGRAANDVWAVGGGREPDTDYASLLLHWDGSAWSESYICNPEGTRFASGGWVAVLADVAGSVDGALWAAGACGPGASFIPFGHVVDDGGTGSWVDDLIFADSRIEFRPLVAIWAAPGDDVWAAAPQEAYDGHDATMLHFDGAAWSISPQTITGGVNDLGGTTASDVWAVGKAGKRLHHDGTTWSEQP